MTDVDPQFPHYYLRATTFDGPRVRAGECVEVRLWCRVEAELPVDEQLAHGRPITLSVFDFAGPTVIPDPAIAPALEAPDGR